MVFFDPINIIVSVASLMNFIIGIIIYIHQPKSAINRSFFSLMMIISVWAFLMVLFRSLAGVNEYDLITVRIMYAVAIFVPALFLVFVIDLLNYKSRFFYMLKIVNTSFVLFVMLWIVQTDILIFDIVLLERKLEPLIIFNKVSNLIYASYIGIAFGVSYLLLVSSIIKSKQGKFRRQVIYILISTGVASSITLTTNLILPILGNFQFNWVGQISLLLMVLFLTYGIYKEQMFNARVATVEVLVSFSLVLALTQIIVSSSLWTTVFSSASLIFFGIFGVVLLRTINREIHAREDLSISNKRFKKLNKRLEEMDEKKNEFLHIATHQLRGPITAINGYASLIVDGDYGAISAKAVKPVEKILSASKVMSETINDYMNIARIEEDNVVQNKTNFDLCKLVDERAGVLMVNAKEKSIDFKVKNIVPDNVCTVNADKNNITQVLNALIENAIKYTMKGNVTVESKLTNDNKKVSVSIKDTGIGVAKNEVAGLFDKFTRADNAKETDAFGTGMGLFIAKNLIEANSGSVKVESEGLNKGTTFTIELPVVGA